MFFRWDLTQEKRYTISDATKKLLQNLEHQVVIKVYLTGDFPAGFERLERAERIHAGIGAITFIMREDDRITFLLRDLDRHQFIIEQPLRPCRSGALQVTSCTPACIQPPIYGI